MKKIIVTLSICAVAFIIASCTPSNEEKAEKLIKETLKDYLYHPDSYEPTATRIDSMFIDASTIEPIMEISNEIKDLISKINGCERKIEFAEITAPFWLHFFQHLKAFVISVVPFLLLSDFVPTGVIQCIKM